jgi:hypothetical protein
VAFGLDGAAVGADLVGPAGGIAAGLGGFDRLAQDLGQDRSLADVDRAGCGEQGHRPGRGQGAQLAELGPLDAAGQLVQVAPAELGEFFRIVPVPLAQFGGRRGVLGPLGQVGRVLAQAARPDPVHEYAGAVVGRGRVVDAADPDLWHPPSSG